jgi:hypothetical protein
MAKESCKTIRKFKRFSTFTTTPRKTGNDLKNYFSRKDYFAVSAHKEVSLSMPSLLNWGDRTLVYFCRAKNSVL